MKNLGLKAFLMAVLCGCLQFAWADKYFYVLLPDTGIWAGATPMISLDAGQSGLPLIADRDIPGWYSYKFAEDQLTDNALIFCEDALGKRAELGMNGTGETGTKPEPIMLETIFLALEMDSAFFVLDVSRNEPPGKAGVYASLSDIGGGGSHGYTEGNEPMIAFVSAPSAGSSIVTGPGSDAGEFLTNVKYKLYLAVMEKNGNGEYEICRDCDYLAVMGAKTSIGISMQEATFRNGYATVAVSSDRANSAMIEVCISLGGCATYGPMEFKTNPDVIPSGMAALKMQRLDVYRAGTSSLAIRTQKMRGEAFAVMDMQGRVVRKGVVSADEMVLSGFSAGSYVVKVSSDVCQIDLR